MEGKTDAHSFGTALSIDILESGDVDCARDCIQRPSWRDALLLKSQVAAIAVPQPRGYHLLILVQIVSWAICLVLLLNREPFVSIKGG